MNGMFQRLRAFLKERGVAPGSLGILLGVMVLLLAVCVLVGGGFAREQVFPVYISEIVASNTGYPNEQGRCCDFIEIYNSADYAVDLTGYQLGDIEGKTRYAFPSGTVISPGAFLSIYCDKATSGEGYAPFEIARAGGELFYLIAKNGAVVDQVQTVALDADQAMVRLDDRSWEVSQVVTPGAANDVVTAGYRDIYNSGLSPVRITELSSGSNGYLAAYQMSCDWVELHNTSDEPVDISGFILSDNVGNDKYHFPQGVVLAPGEYFVVSCTEQVAAPEVAPFGIAQDVAETVVLKMPDGRIVEIIETMPMTSGSMALQSDGSWEVTREISAGFENTENGNQEYLLKTGAKPGNIRISELTAAQQLTVPDSFGEFPDWVELYNASQQTIDLSGWYLTDDPAQMQKWMIPSLVLEPGEREVIFCSGRDTQIDGQLHASFGLSAGGESLSLYAHGGVEVDTVNFPAAQDYTAFTFDNGQAFQTDTPTPGYPNDQLGYEEYCAARTASGPIAIWEVMTANDRYLPQQLGNCYDWVELRNISDQPVNLEGFSISDDPQVPDMHKLASRVLQPGEKVTIILSGEPEMARSGYEHADFSLNAREESLLLYDASGNLLDYVFLDEIPLETSYGRMDGMGGFFYMAPTPGGNNDAGFRSKSGDVTSSYAPGVYSADSSFTVTLESAGEIYYTTDGSVPTERSQHYTGPVTLNETTVLRAVCVEEEKLAGDVYTATFVVGDTHSLPVVSLVTDPEGLWGSNGIYRNGDISVKEIRLPSNVAYSGPDGAFSLDCAMNLHGATTVTAFNKKSFALHFLDSYDGPLQFDVFEDGEVTTFRSLIVRTAHENVYSSQMHDVLMAHVANLGSENVITQKYRYVSLYLNGEYWGLYAIRERHSQEHYASYRNVPAETVEINRFMVDNYDSTLYDLYNFVGYNSLAVEENYAYVKTQLDVESFADWMIYEAYVSDIDIYGNIRYYRSPEDGLWRMGLADLDLGMMGRSAAFEEVYNTFHHSRLVQSLMANAEFRDLLATRLATLLKGPLSDENMVATINEIADEIRPETVWEEKRWGTPVSGWQSAVDYMIRFCDGRGEEMINSLCWMLNLDSEQREFYFGDLE